MGLAALLGFSYPIGLADLADARGLVGLVVVVVLPFIGAAWLLVTSWRFLLAGPVLSDTESHVPRT